GVEDLGAEPLELRVAAEQLRVDLVDAIPNGVGMLTSRLLDQVREARALAMADDLVLQLAQAHSELPRALHAFLDCRQLSDVSRASQLHQPSELRLGSGLGGERQAALLLSSREVAARALVL